MIRSPAGFDGGDRIKRYLDYYQPSYGVTMLSPGQFSPASLFAAGEQGAWYDPSDFSTMFQDSAGTTPVTAVEQPVGLILDKSGRGNNASQATAGSRPTLSAMVNLLTYTEQFNNAVWTQAGLNAFGSGSVANTTATTDPLGGNTADFIQESTANSTHLIYRAYTAVAVPYTFAVALKAAGRNWVKLVHDSTGTKGAWFNLSTGEVGTKDTGVTAPPPVALGNDWYRCSITATLAAVVNYPAVYITTADNTIAAYTGNGTSGVYIWGADLRVTNDGVGLPAYQRVAAATDYDTAGFPYYLLFDGSNDSFATGTITPGADKAQVFVGIRKTSDAALAIVAELSATIATNAGSFALTAPNSAAANYNFSSKGTTQTNNTVTTYTSPLTSVLSGIADIAGASNLIRANGAQVGSVLTTQGTGNYLAYPLYIGRRGGTSSPFTGRLYSLILRFSAANLSDAQITNTETWVNGKTGAY